MAHFGLTALGPQSPYLFKHRFSVAIFEISDFASAFDRVVAHIDSESLPLENVPDILRIVYRGPPPQEEGDRVNEAIALAAGTSGLLSRDSFLKIIAELQVDQAPAEAARARAAHFSSFESLEEHRHRNVRPVETQQSHFACPLTQSAVVGWRAGEPPLGDARYPKIHCEETKYAAALHASGVF